MGSAFLHLKHAAARAIERRGGGSRPRGAWRRQAGRRFSGRRRLGVTERSSSAPERLDAFAVPADDRRLVHADVGLHNLAFAPASLCLTGVFDFAEAAYADRHWDLRHLLWPGAAAATFTALVDAYGARGGAPIDRARVELYQATTAAAYLAYRDGIEAERVWCGRTLAEDLAWTRGALAAIGEL